MQIDHSDQNRMDVGNYDGNMMSPLISKGDQRSYFTDSKVPFKNSNYDRNIPFYSECKQSLLNRFNQDNENQSLAKVKQSFSMTAKAIEQGSNYFGDRFIPCRQGSNDYEMQFSYEEQQQLTNAQTLQNAINDVEPFDSIANSSNGQSQGRKGSGDHNLHVYTNLLQTQCLGSSMYLSDNYFENLSSRDCTSSSNDLTLSNGAQSANGLQTPSGSSPIQNSSQNQTTVRAKKSLFKYQNKNNIGNIENSPYQVSPLLNVDSYDYASPSIKTARKIPKMPFKVLDAPQLQDDFYLNLVDWSSTNILAVGLGRAVYIWSACTSRVTKLCEMPADDSITSVSWSQRGTHLAVGTNSGDTQIWDTNHCKLVRTLTGHLSRVGASAWNGSIVSTGSRDRNILQRDLRASNQYISKLVGHKQEVCGLKWSFDDQQLASGGNDNKLMIWSLHNDQAQAKFSDHTAAVKAIAWSPHQNGLLASGGGTADRCIRFWNTNTLQPINYIDTGSQVCNLMFSKNNNEIVSTHGYSLNQIIMWKYPTMQKVATLTGHTYRVLYLSMSPDGQNIVTGAGDETLRFWNAFPSLKGKSDSMPFGGSSSLVPSSMDIR